MHRLGTATSGNDAPNLCETFGLYDLTCGATVSPDISDLNEIKNCGEAWKLKSATNERYLVLASCGDLTVFSLGEKIEYCCTTSIGDTITDIAILGESCFLVAIVNNSKILVLSLERKEIYYNQTTDLNLDFVHCNPTHDVCYLTFGSFSGKINTLNLRGDIALSKEHNRFENLSNNEIIDYLNSSVPNVNSRNINMSGIDKNIHLICDGSLQSFASFGKSGGISWNSFFENDFINLEVEEDYAQIRKSGRYAFILSKNGFIHVFDPITLSFLYEFDVKSEKSQEIIDFIIVDANEFDLPNLFALLVKNGGKAEMMIYDREKNECCLTIPTVQETTIFSYSGSDRMLLLIEESQTSEGIEKSCINIRQVSQSRPEMKFEALLKNNRFDEAEKFAKTYSLDLQRVYKGKVYFLITRCDNDDESFKQLMETTNLITDHNMVAETFFTLVEMSRRFDRIHTYLLHAKKLRITDLEILKSINNVCFILATYRIIRGPEDLESHLDEHILDMFLDCIHGNDRWLELYMEFISTSAMTEARVIWCRHGKSVMEVMSESVNGALVEKLDNLFVQFLDSFTNEISNWRSVIEHVITDILPDCIDLTDLLIPRIESLVENLIKLLEYRDSQNWPDNAIEAAGCFDLMTEILSNNVITPSDQSYLALNGRVLCANDGTSSPISRMKKVLNILKDIKRLKEVYQCTISYSSYPATTAERICHKILQNALINPDTVLDKIEKLVKPFMAERYLNQDETIFNYIQIMSGEADIQKKIIGWEKQCVQLCSSLSDESRKCRSIISIAASAKLPWPNVLHEAVDKVLKSQTLSRADIEEMQVVCHKVEFTRLLSSYGYERNFMSLLNADSHVELILIIRCVLSQTEKSSRYVDCIKIIELFTLVYRIDWRRSVKVELVKSQAIIHMMRTGEMTSSIINYLNDLDEKEKWNCVDLVMKFVYSVADTPVTKEIENYRNEILGIGEELISYFTCRGNENEESFKLLRKQLVLLREFEKREGTCIVLSDLKARWWQLKQLKKIMNSEITFIEKLIRCNSMGICCEDLVSLMLAISSQEEDLEMLINIFVDCVDSIGPWINSSKLMADLLVDLLAFIVFRLPNISAEEAELERAEAIAWVVNKLAPSIRSMISVFPHEVLTDDLNHLLQLEAYFYLSERVIKQSLRGQDAVAMNSDSGHSIDSVTISTYSEPKVFGFGRRHGIYDISSDPALFEGISAVLAIANVAPTVARPYESDISDDSASEYRSTWEQLSMFLSMHSQDLLDVSCRIYASSLKCWSGEWRQTVVEISHGVVSVVERMLQQEKFDSWHAVTLLCGIPAEQIEKRINQLRISAGVKRSTQSQLNFMNLAFFMSVITNRRDMIHVILSAYDQKAISKQLAKEGIRCSFGHSSEFVDKIITQAAELAVPLAPIRLHEYLKIIVEKFLRDSKVSVAEYMVRYASILVRKASAAGNVVDSPERFETINKYLHVAGSSLYLVSKDDADIVCNYFINLLYVVCPYNYEVLQFITITLGNYAIEGEHKDFHSNLRNIFDFLWTYNRSSHITREESVWLTKRERALQHDEKEYEKSRHIVEPFGYGLRMSYEGNANDLSDTISSDNVRAVDSMVYEKDDVIITDIPPLSSKRIPLHIFLMRKKEDIDAILMPIVKAELSIYNVSLWQHALRSVSWLGSRFSRTQLLSSAIFAHANRYATVGRSLPVEDKLAILQLLNSNSNRTMVITTIALLFRKIILSDVKIELLQMGVEMAERWTKAEVIEPPMSAEEREKIEEHCLRLKDGIAKFFTELSLKKNGLYNEKTAELIEKAEELFTFIYDEMIDWTNSSDVEKKTAIVENIANAYGIDLTKMHERILFNWIEDTEHTPNYEHFDANDSLGEESFMDQCADNSQSTDHLNRLPIFDKSVDKMVYLCGQIDKSKLLNKLSAILIKGSIQAKGGYNSVARASCVLLRKFTNEELHSWNENASHIWICENLENEMYTRLMYMNGLKYDINADKTQLVRTLLQSPSRTPAMASLIACLIIDYEYKDVSNIEKVMARLQMSKQWNILKALLSYARAENLAPLIRSFALLWFRVYENSISEVNGGSMTNKEWNNGQCVLLRKSSLWAMSCTVEGGRQTSITVFLREIGCQISAAIVSILSSFTTDKMAEIDHNILNMKRDIPLRWANRIEN